MLLRKCLGLGAKVKMIVKFFGVDAPKGTEFISCIIPMVLFNVAIIAFPVLFVIFYLKDSNTFKNIKDNMLNIHDPEIKNQEMLREYHGMLKEGIITQDEFDSIKKKYLKELHKS